MQYSVHIWLHACIFSCTSERSEITFITSERLGAQARCPSTQYSALRYSGAMPGKLHRSPGCGRTVLLSMLSSIQTCIFDN